MLAYYPIERATVRLRVLRRPTRLSHCKYVLYRTILIYAILFSCTYSILSASCMFTRDGTAEPVRRDQNLRRERAQRENMFSLFS